jgi:hypothetical protein
MFENGCEYFLSESGTRLPDTCISTTRDGIWLIKDFIPEEPLVAFITAPSVYGPGIVRAAESNIDFVSTSIENGVLKLTWNSTSVVTKPDAVHTVVKEINNNGTSVGNCVTKITVGNGLKLESTDDEGHGVCDIKLDNDATLTGIEPSTVDLNAALMRVSDYVQYTVLPSNRDASITYTFRVPPNMIGAKSMKVILAVRGTVSGDIGELSLKGRVIQAPTVDGVPVGTQFTNASTASVTSTVRDNIYRVEKEFTTSVTVRAGDTVILNVKAANIPSEDIELFQTTLAFFNV